MSPASIRAPGRKGLGWFPASEALPAVSGSLSCSFILASKEVLRDLPERGSQRCQANDEGAEFARSLRRFGAARDDLAEFVQLAQNTVSVGLGLRQFGFSRRQAVLRILGIGGGGALLGGPPPRPVWAPPPHFPPEVL